MVCEGVLAPAWDQNEMGRPLWTNIKDEVTMSDGGEGLENLLESALL